MPYHNFVLGWRLQEQAPRYFLGARARPRLGAHGEKDIVVLDSTKARNHAAILAQSGSGKSFLLGRLIEELILKTKARCLIFDPNSDYRCIQQIDPEVWADAGYDKTTESGKCPTDPNLDHFASRWSKVPSMVYQADFKSTEDITTRPLLIPWPSIPADVIASTASSPSHQFYLRSFHNVVKALSSLCSWGTLGEIAVEPVVAAVAKFLETAKNRRPPLSTLRRELQTGLSAGSALSFDSDTIAENIGKIEPGLRRLGDLLRELPSIVAGHKRVLEEAPSIEPQIADYYLEMFHQLVTARVLGPYCVAELKPLPLEEALRLEVVDLPSIPDLSTRLLVVSGILSREWSSARRKWELAIGLSDPKMDPRRPTFIIVDEAHHLLPNDESLSGPAHAVREQLRVIAGEGRKFGIFLIIVSQRPDKLDERILSECQNAILMKIGSQRVLDEAVRTLGLDQSDEISGCRNLLTGRAVAVGAWVDRPTPFYVAARRTVEGGRDIQNSAWLGPFPDLEGPEFV